MEKPIKKRKNSRRKGVVGERAFAQLLRLYGIEARRGQQFSGSPNSPDVVCSIPVHFEVKRVEKLNIYNAIKQAMKDCPDGSGKWRAVAHKKNREDWLVTMQVEDFMDLITDWYALANK